MSDKQFAPRDKKVQKNTRHGAVEQNTATGEETRISQKEQDFELRPGDGPKKGHRPRAAPETQDAGSDVQQGAGEHKARAPRRPDVADADGRLRYKDSENPGDAPKADRQHGSKYQQMFADEPEAPASFRDKLQFSKDELPPDGKLDKLRGKAERVDGKLAEARKKMRTRQRPVMERTFDEASGKGKTRLHFEQEVLPPASPKRPGAVKRAGGLTVQAGANKFHQKIREVEHENVGTQAAHHGEMAAEGVYRGGKRAGKSALQYARNRPYRRIAKLEQKSVKANAKLAYHKALNENPKLKSNPLSRMMQKMKIRRQYAKAARDAKRAGRAAQKAGSLASRAIGAVVNVVKRHPVVFAVIGLLALLMLIIMTSFSSCSGMAMGSMTTVLASQYLAPDADIDNAELAYTEWETDLQLEILNTEADRPGYDEYRYNVADIGHNPYELMAYLTAAYNDFEYAAVEPVLRQIFGEQYTLTYREEVEERYNDPEDENGDDDLEPYDWYILHVTLTARNFTDLVAARMNSDESQLYELLMQSKGNRQYAYAPFDFNWLPYVTSYYGYRVHPISGEKDYHKAVDIAVPAGTEILAAHDGTITTAANDSSYGLYLVLDDGEGLVTKYAHCSQLLVSAGQTVKQGDVIAKVGSTGTSSGAHLHFEVIKDGQYLNPLYFAATNDDGSGSLPPGTPGGPEIPDYPGAPMGDGSYAALLEEAQKHLGKAYVFGASGPNNFDCSGFVCWCLNQSGVASVGRTTAQGLYNMCTPVSRANAQPGDLVFFHSTYSTSNVVTHVGIYIGNGMMIHCGDPIGYASIDSSYWQNHFYAFGRI